MWRQKAGSSKVIRPSERHGLIYDGQLFPDRQGAPEGVNRAALSTQGRRFNAGLSDDLFFHILVVDQHDHCDYEADDWEAKQANNCNDMVHNFIRISSSMSVPSSNAYAQERSGICDA